MSRKVKSVRVPEELGSLDLSNIVRECEAYLRDLESATLLKAQGNKAAAEALIKTREADLGRKVARKVWEARVEYGKQHVRSEHPQEHALKTEPAPKPQQANTQDASAAAPAQPEEEAAIEPQELHGVGPEEQPAALEAPEESFNELAAATEPAPDVETTQTPQEPVAPEHHRETPEPDMSAFEDDFANAAALLNAEDGDAAPEDETALAEGLEQDAGQADEESGEATAEDLEEAANDVDMDEVLDDIDDFNLDDIEQMLADPVFDQDGAGEEEPLDEGSPDESAS